MSAPLPDLSEEEFRRRLEPWLDLLGADPAPSLKRLVAHYAALRRWSPRLSLVGPGTAGEVVERHYGESLEGLRVLSEGCRSLLDVGSGAGFPGLVLAGARPDLEVALGEARERKAAFLRSAARAMDLSVKVWWETLGREVSCGARPVVEAPGEAVPGGEKTAEKASYGETPPGELPPGGLLPVDCLTARAIRFQPEVWSVLTPQLADSGEILVWAGRETVQIPGFSVHREQGLAGHFRRILVYRRNDR